jgi:hypothetical protein
MTVPAGMSDDLWEWLLDQGWREVTCRPDRRGYRQAPVSCALKLTEASADIRARVLDEAVDAAEIRVCYRVAPDVLPSYVQRK